MLKPRCIKGKQHIGKYFKHILSVSIDSQIDNAVHWCSECGIVTVDEESDGRFMGSLSGFKRPRVVYGPAVKKKKRGNR